MLRIKQLAGTLLILAVLFAQVGNVAAAPLTQETIPITGTIQDITTETDTSGVTTVLVTLVDDQGATQTVRLNLETAASLGLVALDATTQEVVIHEDRVGQTVVIDPATVISDEEQSDGPVHPIAWLLADFFGEDPSIIDGYHDDGFGFGVIAQALWMSRNLTPSDNQPGDASLAKDILQAKRDKDFESFFENHPEYLVDGNVPTNWGQFKKALAEKKNNLGVIVSGHEDADATPDGVIQEQDHGNSKEKDHGKDKDKGKGKNKNKNKP